MVRRNRWAAAALAVLVVGLVASVAIAAPAKKPRRVRVSIAMSHTHPVPNPGFSFVCVRITGTLGARVRVNVDGPNNYHEFENIDSITPGGVIASFRIDTPGEYKFDVLATKRRFRKAQALGTHDVPPPPTNGPFECPEPVD